MARIVTIVFDDELLKKLRNIQAKLVKTEKGSVSLSRVMNDVIREGLKKKKSRILNI